MNKASTIQCECGVYIFFLKEFLAGFETFDEGAKAKHNKKPLEVENGAVKSYKIHECLDRGFSIKVKCKHCLKPIQFHNAITSDRGKKIPHDCIFGKYLPHVCMRATIA